MVDSDNSYSFNGASHKWNHYLTKAVFKKSAHTHTHKPTYAPPTEPRGDQSLEEAVIGGRGGLRGPAPRREVVHDCCSWSAGAVGIGAAARGVAGEVGVSGHGGYSRMQVRRGSRPALGGSARGRGEEQ